MKFVMFDVLMWKSTTQMKSPWAAMKEAQECRLEPDPLPYNENKTVNALEQLEEVGMMESPHRRAFRRFESDDSDIVVDDTAEPSWFTCSCMDSFWDSSPKDSASEFAEKGPVSEFQWTSVSAANAGRHPGAVYSFRSVADKGRPNFASRY